MTLVNTETGEIVAVHPEEPGAIAMLDQAIHALTTALDQMPISEVATLKAKVATVATATRELGMSKEAQELAIEAVRRAEWALGRAIRKAQEEGSVSNASNHNRLAVPSTAKAAPTDFASDLELYDRPSQGKAGILTIGEASPEEFDAAIEEAKAENNLSRANVSRKLQKKSEPEAPRRTTRDEKAAQLADLAAQGYTSQQIATRIGYSTSAQVRELAKERGIDIPADAVTSKRRGLNSNRILSGAAESLEVTAFSLQQIDLLELDQEQAQEWVDSLTESIKALSKAVKTIKESIQ